MALSRCATLTIVAAALVASAIIISLPVYVTFKAEKDVNEQVNSTSKIMGTGSSPMTEANHARNLSEL